MFINVECGDYNVILRIRLDKNGRPYGCGCGVSVFFQGKAAREVRRLFELEKAAEMTGSLPYCGEEWETKKEEQKSEDVSDETEQDFFGLGV